MVLYLIGLLFFPMSPRLYSQTATLLVYINDIVCNIKLSFRLFDDDISLYVIVENPNSAARSLI